jgi:hypothetical protein
LPVSTPYCLRTRESRGVAIFVKDFFAEDFFAEVQNLGIEVKVNVEDGVQQTVETTFVCRVTKNCGKRVDLYSDGPNTTQNVVCPQHGKICTFPNYATFRETVKLVVNKILAANGHDLLTDATKHVPGDDNRDPSKVN